MSNTFQFGYAKSFLTQFYSTSTTVEQTDNSTNEISPPPSHNSSRRREPLSNSNVFTSRLELAIS